MNDIELNAILYYADFLSLKETSLPVTDNCKYFFVYGVPMNSLYILDMLPIYDPSNKYFKLALAEYITIRDKFGDEGVETFVDDICSIRACGSVNAELMLKCIHQFSSKRERKLAFSTYYKWKDSLAYYKITIDENGNPQERPCTSYVYHIERMAGRPVVFKGG